MKGLAGLARTKTVYICDSCGYETPKWLGKCPGCAAWNSFVSVAAEPPAKLGADQGEPPKALNEPMEELPRSSTGFLEFDRVLGGGLVPGSVVLLGGEPGVGKSTLLLQAAAAFASMRGPVFYVSGEESFQQLRLRAKRLGVLSDAVQAVNETDVLRVISYAERLQPGLVILDSIQTMVHPEIPGFPGGVSQVRECTTALVKWAKAQQVPCLIVGHITKTGGLAGPKVLEHLVDTVLYFEGDPYSTHRLLRAVKNRYGATHELALFEMGDKGLIEVASPSTAFLAERHPGQSGTVVTAAMEGNMPLLVEVQALAAPAGYASPRRLVNGLDQSRVGMVLAVLEKRAGLVLSNQDVFVSAIGGVRLEEPAVDLSVALAVASSLLDKALPQDLVAFGEVGLTGEVRRVANGRQRVHEALRLGFRRAVLPRSLVKELQDQAEGMELIGVRTIGETMAKVWG